MSSANGPEGLRHRASDIVLGSRPSVECQLLESLVHHLIEKGVLTRNDALSVIQTVAQVKRGAMEEEMPGDASADYGLSMLQRLYASFELMSDRRSEPSDEGNVLQLRPPLHGNRPTFSDEN